MGRIIAAFVYAPIVGLFFGDIFVNLIYSWGVGPLTLLSAIIVYPVVLVLFFPILFIMRRKQWLSLWSFLLVGILLAAVCWTLLFFPFQRVETESSPFSYGLFGLVSGLIGSFVFWFLGIKDNPTLTHQSSGTGEKVLL